MPRAACQSEVFLRLLDFLPRKGAAAVLEAYFDESERCGGTFCIAGYAFAKQQAKKFTKEWSRLFAGFDGGFHMVDLVHLRGAFANISPNERDALIVEAVKTISTRMSFGVAVSCNVIEIKKHAPAEICGFGHAYPVCCHLAMSGLGAHLDHVQNYEDVLYTFESGHEYEGEARRFMANAIKNRELKRSYHHFGDSFLPKSAAVPLGCADFLAWEWTKFWDETIERKIRPMRKSFRELVRSAPKRYRVFNVTGAPLVKYMGQVRELGLFQGIEDDPVTAE